MLLQYYKDNFSIKIPIARNGIFWNGRADSFSNITGRMDYSQEFGMTAYAKTGVYGYSHGVPRPHNGHDFAGPQKTDLVAPCRCYCTWSAFDKNGYGNYIFIETEMIKTNGENIKMEFVLAHMRDKALAEVNKWYNEGETLGFIGSTGMSTGSHVHFGGRPLVVSPDGGIKWAVKDKMTRGYVDLTEFFITRPIYNKQDLINERMRLIKKKGTSDVYAISPNGRANLILNWATYRAGLIMGIWEDKVDNVNELPELEQIIILTPNN